MSRALIVALVSGMAAAGGDGIEWEGIFYTPDDSYKWGADGTADGSSYKYGPGGDPGMKMALIPVANPALNGTASESSFKAALEAIDSKGTAAMGLTCTDVAEGGVLTPMEGKCYNIVFDTSKAQSLYTINATGVSVIAFWTQHLPTEFEVTDHYLKDTSSSKVDIEPMFQDPVPSAGGHDHGAFADEFEGKCVCQAKQHGWQLDCSKKAKIQEAVDALEANAACKAANPPDTCKDHYYVMQAHHDHCLHDALPTGIEVLLHAYEGFYDDCFIKRQYDANLGACPAVDCTDQAAMTSAIATLQAGCGKDNTTTCSGNACSVAVKVVLMAHDICKEDQLPNNLETALHSYEEPCEAQLCNTAPGPFDPTTEACSGKVSAASRIGSQAAFWLTMSAFWMLALS